MTKLVTPAGPNGYPEIFCPQVLKLKCQSDTLVAQYMERYDSVGRYHTLVLNGGRDVIFGTTEIETRFPDTFASIFHLKASGDSLWGMTYSGKHLYQLFWHRISLDFPLTKSQFDSLESINAAESKAGYFKAQKAKRNKGRK